jgi:hypothetical protein
LGLFFLLNRRVFCTIIVTPLKNKYLKNIF